MKQTSVIKDVGVHAESGELAQLSGRDHAGGKLLSDPCGETCVPLHENYSTTPSHFLQLRRISHHKIATPFSDLVLIRRSPHHRHLASFPRESECSGFPFGINLEITPHHRYTTLSRKQFSVQQYSEDVLGELVWVRKGLWFHLPCALPVESDLWWSRSGAGSHGNEFLTPRFFLDGQMGLPRMRSGLRFFTLLTKPQRLVIMVRMPTRPGPPPPRTVPTISSKPVTCKVCGNKAVGALPT